MCQGCIQVCNNTTFNIWISRYMNWNIWDASKYTHVFFSARLSGCLTSYSTTSEFEPFFNFWHFFPRQNLFYHPPHNHQQVSLSFQFGIFVVVKIFFTIFPIITSALAAIATLNLTISRRCNFCHNHCFVWILIILNHQRWQQLLHCLFLLKHCFVSILMNLNLHHWKQLLQFLFLAQALFCMNLNCSWLSPLTTVITITVTTDNHCFVWILIILNCQHWQQLLQFPSQLSNLNWS